MTRHLETAQIGNRAQCQGYEDHAYLQSCRSTLLLSKSRCSVIHSLNLLISMVYYLFKYQTFFLDLD
jgi:hypothetical protein